MVELTNGKATLICFGNFKALFTPKLQLSYSILSNYLIQNPLFL